MKKVAMAVAAHPDDIEFLMAGTLVLLKNAGYEIHYMNLSTGNCGSTVHDSEDTTRIRMKEAQNASEVLGATFHPPITNDFEIMYALELLRKLAAVIRKVKPSVILTHSPSDYMEDHMNTSRLATTAAFVRGVRNFETDEPAVSNYNCAIYHAVPHGLMDPLRQKVYPEMFVDTASVQPLKRNALEAHQIPTSRRWKISRWRSAICRRFSNMRRAGADMHIMVFPKPDSTLYNRWASWSCVMKPMLKQHKTKSF
jgi:LmbE family N-acetylglucosaminyl deacetylase